MQVDLGAVARISRRVDLRDIRLIDLSASLSPGEVQLLEPDVTFECSAEHPVPDKIIVLCDYRFVVTSAGASVAEVTAKYILVYELQELLEISRDDLQQFAYANGTYHSWPFLRQLLFDLTSRMGLPPFTLPVFKVLPQAKPEEQGEEEGSKRELPPPKAKGGKKKKQATTSRKK